MRICKKARGNRWVIVLDFMAFGDGPNRIPWGKPKFGWPNKVFVCRNRDMVKVTQQLRRAGDFCLLVREVDMPLMIEIEVMLLDRFFEFLTNLALR